MASNKSNTKPAHMREVYAYLLLCFSLVMFLSFISFEPEDISWIKEPPNSPAHNFIGPIGAWLTYVMAWPLGNGAWVLFGLCLGFGVGFLVAGEKIGLRPQLWSIVLLLTGCGLIDLFFPQGIGPMSVYAQAPGGYIGRFIARDLLAPVAPVGPYIVLPTVWLIGLVMLTGIRPLHDLTQWFIVMRARWEAEREKLPADKRSDLRADLIRKQRELDRQVKAIEKQTKRVTNGAAAAKSTPQEQEPEAVSEPIELPPQDFTIRDHSLPEPKIEQASIPTVMPANEKAAAKAIAAAIAPARSRTEALGARLKRVPDPVPEEPEMSEEVKVVPVPPTPKPAVPAPVSTQPPARKPELKPKPAKPEPALPPVSYDNWQLPSIELLAGTSIGVAQPEVVEDLKQNAAILQSTLADFGLDVRIGEVTKGPVITRYELLPGSGVKVEKITSLQNNIALAMKAASIRIMAPIPGKSAVGIEVPNSTSTVVYLRDVLDSETWTRSKAKLPLALGKDVSGNVIIADLADMPHILIAGATGAGKTVCLNAIIAGLLFNKTPDQLKFVFVDPKIVEMQMFNALPHLVMPVVNDPKKVPLALRWLINEMERRYQIFAKVSVRNISGFNARDPKNDPKPPTFINEDGEQEELPITVPRDFELKVPQRLPYVVLVVDELADLMMTAPADIEMAIARLAQLARATGIHMILATQRPSVDVITGVIKANFPARIAFQVASKQDSRVILDANGADKLLGKGDMLYLPPGSSKLVRAQGVYVQDEELRKVVECITKQAPPAFEKEITQKLTKETPTIGEMDGGDEDEELIEQCIEVIRQTKRASVSILQRRLRIGYTRAARIMDILEERGIVGPHKGAEPRDILIDLDGEIPSNEQDDEV